MIYRTRFSDRVSKPLICTMDERKTKSEFADECDINKIMARYRKTGELPVTALQAADRFGDFSQVLISRKCRIVSLRRTRCSPLFLRISGSVLITIRVNLSTPRRRSRV